MLAQRLAALAVERQAGGVDEYGGEVGEEIAATVEQLLLDQVLDTARRERGRERPSGGEMHIG